MLLLFTAFACSSTSTTSDKNDPHSEPVDTTRIVLHEAFSGSNCGPCEPASRNLEAALTEADGRYAMVKYQIGSDPYISSEAVDRRMFYLPEEETYGIPYVHADGTHAFHPNEMDDGEAYGSDDFEVYSAAESVVAVTVAMELNDQTIATSIDVHPTADVIGDNLRLMVAIIEHTTTGNVGSNGQTEFHNVFKKFVPDGNGTPLAHLLSDEPVVVDLEYTFQGEYTAETSLRNPVNHATEHTVEEFDDLAVIAWVQDMDTWTVYNTGQASLH